MSFTLLQGNVCSQVGYNTVLVRGSSDTKGTWYVWAIANSAKTRYHEFGSTTEPYMVAEIASHNVWL